MIDWINNQLYQLMQVPRDRSVERQLMPNTAPMSNNVEDRRAGQFDEDAYLQSIEQTWQNHVRGAMKNDLLRRQQDNTLLPDESILNSILGKRQ